MKLLKVSSSPHIKDNISTSKIMIDVIIALIPSLLASVIFFGVRALLVTISCILASVVFEHLFCVITKRKSTIKDYSAVVTGMLLAFNLPVTIPLWIAVIGCFVAIVIIKQLFGGIGQNFANPAIAARVILLVSFTAQMTKWTLPFASSGIDAITTATPLSSEATQIPSLFDMFIGNMAGCIGETSALALLIGGGYLLYKKIISPTIPLVYIGTVALMFFITGMSIEKVLAQLFMGGLMIGSIFMATDYSTSPITNKGKIIFAIGCGLITFAIRQYGTYPEGVSFSILFMNILVPYIDRFTRSKPL